RRHTELAGIGDDPSGGLIEGVLVPHLLCGGGAGERGPGQDRPLQATRISHDESPLRRGARARQGTLRRPPTRNGERWRLAKLDGEVCRWHGQSVERRTGKRDAAGSAAPAVSGTAMPAS